MKNKIIFVAKVNFILLISLLVSGCVSQPYSIVESNSAQGYKGTADSVYVVSHVSARQPEFDALLAKSMTDKFENEGYSIKYVSSNGLELNPARHQTAAKRFGAKLAVIISPAGGTLASRFSNSLLDSKYVIKGLDLKIKRVVFKSHFQFHPWRDDLVKGTQWNSISADKFAADVFDELLKHGILVTKS